MFIEGVYSRCNITNSHSITYISNNKAFSLTASSMVNLLVLIDLFWCPSNPGGLQTITTLNRALDNNNEVTQVIELSKVA